MFVVVQLPLHNVGWMFGTMSLAKRDKPTTVRSKSISTSLGSFGVGLHPFV